MSPRVRSVAVGVGVAVLLPVFLSVALPSHPPIGVYLQGAVVGTLYALVAMGLVLVYRSNRIINFAQASMGAAPAVAAILLHTNRGWSFPLCVALAVIGSLALGAVVDIVFIRRFNSAPRLILTVATIGVAQLLSFVEVMLPRWIGGDSNVANTFQGITTPLSSATVQIGDQIFNGNHALTIVVVALACAGLGLFFRLSRVGVATRAAAENSDRALLLGVPVRRVSTTVWAIAGLLSGLGIFLRVPVVGGLPIGGLVGTSTLLYALAPAVVARMQNLPVAFGAGIALGVVDQSLIYETRSSTMSSIILLPVILVTLLVQRRRGGRAQDTGVATWREVREFRPVPRELASIREIVAARWVLRVVAVGLLVALPHIVGELRHDLASLMLIYAITGVSLVVLTGWAGQISLGQFAFVGAGAAVAGGLAANHQADFFISIIVAGVAGAAVAVALGIPALRLQGLFLAVTTLAFAQNMQSFFLNRDYNAWLLPRSGTYVERPILWGRLDVRGDLAYYYVCLAGLAIAVIAARSVRRHRSGRILIAARDNPRAAQALGVNLARTRLAAFAVSGFLAAMAGALFAYLQGGVDAAVFPPLRSVQIFAMTVIGGLTSVPGAIAGAAYVVGFQYFLPDYQLLATGIGLLLLLLAFPGGLSEVGFRLRDTALRAFAARRGLHVPSLVADDLAGGRRDEVSVADAAAHAATAPTDGREEVLR